MLNNTIVALRRADRALCGALALSLALAAGAGATTLVPSTDKSGDPAPAQQSQTAPVPVRLAAEDDGSVVNPTPFAESADTDATPPSFEQLVLQKVLDEQRCLAEAMYYEARGEGVDGQKAIAEVVFHRMRSAGFPHSICGVVYQGAAVRRGCQFSFVCDGEMQLAKAPGAWARAKRLAARILTGLVQLGDETEDAISFHAVDVQPGWGDHLIKTIQIGNHVFYRAAARAAGAS
jgi:hypothetical protein